MDGHVCSVDGDEVMEYTEYELKALEYIQKSGTIYVISNHTAASGMSRVLKLVYVLNNEILTVPSGLMEKAGFKWNKKHGGWKIAGCGMDMGFAMVYAFCLTHYDNGYAVKHCWL